MREDDRPPSDRDLVRILKALGDPNRFQMVRTIAAAGELSCGQVAEHFDFSQPTISHHLKILMDAGILIQRNVGKHHFTSVDHALLKRIAGLVPARLTGVKRGPAHSRPGRRARTG